MSEPRLRGAATAIALVSVAFAVSAVHYLDNVVNYADYPQPEPGATLPTPSAALIAAAWFTFTALGTSGLVLFLRRRLVPAVVCLALYSSSGLIGVGHYTVPGALDMPWWRQLHVVVDIALGVLLLSFALWAFLANRGRRSLAEASANVGEERETWAFLVRELESQGKVDQSTPGRLVLDERWNDGPAVTIVVTPAEWYSDVLSAELTCRHPGDGPGRAMFYIDESIGSRLDDEHFVVWDGRGFERSVQAVLPTRRGDGDFV
ncbi:hypothetical protein [Aeromicrobium sp. Leaf272]|uniref:hypothetical protein n=1 Tax=Aeromicrobium sp. Leaf272 TaxID=1736317 RepID=UPI0006FAED33|nr:hypothetical protein [Aeromicrobium sp. Leaf272]KQP25497.1 hypothetical protein ASF38_13590 [Aeromicrobium sp. Leaf272]